MLAGHRSSDSVRPELPWQTFVPAKLRSDRVLIAVHGIETRAERMLSLLVAKAARRGVAVVAPDFSGAAFKGYQTLAGAGEPMHSADALGSVMVAVREQLGLYGGFDLMGFSGGAQFVHRFAQFNPGMIRHLVAVSSGWYTYLDAGSAFPYGLGPSPRDGLRSADVEGFLAIPKLIAVGECDVERDASLRQTRRVDRSGINRLERARRWHAHLEHLSPGNAMFALLPGTAHSMTQAMRQGGLRNLLFDFIADRAVDHHALRDYEIQHG